jgi:hypothetical protein
MPGGRPACGRVVALPPERLLLAGHSDERAAGLGDYGVADVSS